MKTNITQRSEWLVTPYVAEAFPGKLIDERIEVPVLSIERTFWEKASILHSEAHRPLEKMIPDRYSRHYADVAALAQTESANSALHRDDPRARVIAHSRCFIRLHGLTQKQRFQGLFVLCRKRSAPKFWPAITPKCEICFSVNRHLGVKFLMASKFLKCGLTHLQASSETVSFFMHFPSSTGVTNRDSDCSNLCHSVPVSLDTDMNTLE